MWLLDTRTLQRQYFHDVTTCPPYAILSHCPEVGGMLFNSTFDSVFTSNKSEFRITKNACLEALASGLEMLWSASLCVDSSSTAELSEAINSMFHIYEKSHLCIAYLGDFEAIGDMSADLESHFAQCAWFKRVWMLQELIAPKDLQFHDRDWNRLGSKASLLPILSKVTHIDMQVLEDSCRLFDFCIGKRMSWAASLLATRLEDIAYSLLGIFKVNMTIIYGEGSRAYIRLQENILQDTNDATLFAWRCNDEQQFRGLLAHSPSEFAHFATFPSKVSLRIKGKIKTSSAGIIIEDAFRVQDTMEQALWILSGESAEGVHNYCGIPLRRWNDQFVRCVPQILLSLDELPKGSTRTIFAARSLDFRISSIIANGFSPNRDQVQPPSRPPKRPFEEDIATASGTKIGKEALLDRDPIVNTSNKSSSTLPSRPISKESQDMVDLLLCTDKNNDNTTRPTSVALLSWPNGDPVPSKLTSVLRQFGDGGPMSNPRKYFFAKDGRSGVIHVTMATREGRISLGRLVPTSQPSHVNFELGTDNHCSIPSMDIHESSETSSETEASDAISESDDFESVLDLPPYEVSRLDSHHPYASFVGELSTLGLKRFAEWMLLRQERGKTAEEEAMSLRAKKRRKSDSFESYTEVEYYTDSEDGDTLIVEPLKGTVNHFACPFYIRNSAAHYSCLARTSLLSINDVKRHLWTAHRRPYYCPVCGDVFSKSEMRDGHIKARTCELRPGVAFEGVTEYQMRYMSRRQDPGKSAGEEWFFIWDTIFRGQARPPSPCLSGTIESIICLVRHYWSGEGPKVVRSFLGRTVENWKYDGEGDVASLEATVLDGMIDKLLLVLSDDGKHKKSPIEVEEVLSVFRGNDR